MADGKEKMPPARWKSTAQGAFAVIAFKRQKGKPLPRKSLDKIGKICYTVYAVEMQRIEIGIGLQKGKRFYKPPVNG